MSFEYRRINKLDPADMANAWRYTGEGAGDLSAVPNWLFAQEANSYP